MKSKKFSSPYTSPAVTPRSAPPPPTHDQIAALAHAIWLERGQPAGRDLEHWLEAERQLTAAEPLSTEERVDPATAPAAEIDRELDRIVSPPEPRSPTSL
jgi:hypothetical protein